MPWIKEQFSVEYQMVCDGTTQRPTEKGQLHIISNRFASYQMGFLTLLGLI